MQENNGIYEVIGYTKTSAGGVPKFASPYNITCQEQQIKNLLE